MVVPIVGFEQIVLFSWLMLLEQVLFVYFVMI
jgi:hypothetical protein